MQQVYQIISRYKQPLVIVLSATAGTTDALLEAIDLALKKQYDAMIETKEKIRLKHENIAKELGLHQSEELMTQLHIYFDHLEIMLKGIFYLGEVTARARDSIISLGEFVSTSIFAAYVKNQGKNAVWYDVRQIIVTDDHYGNASPDFQATNQKAQNTLVPLLKENTWVVTQGFIGATPDGNTTTLGRGGSDFSAAILGAAVNAKQVEIWTDVSGIFTCDPRVIKSAYPLQQISFKEAAELAFFGAKVLHPSTILPAMENNIPVIIKNTQDPEAPGTIIEKNPLERQKVKAMAFRKQISMVTIESTRMLNAHGFLEKVFHIFNEHKISVDLISTSEITVSLTLDDETNLEKAMIDLSRIATVEIKTQRAIISLIGDTIKEIPHFLDRVFAQLTEIPVEMITFGASDVNLSLVIPEEFLQESLSRLHREFFE
jgi:aspartate kinase